MRMTEREPRRQQQRGELWPIFRTALIAVAILLLCLSVYNLIRIAVLVRLLD